LSKVNKTKNLLNHFFYHKKDKNIFRLCMRSFTDEKYNKVALEDWSVLFDEYFIYL